MVNRNNSKSRWLEAGVQVLAADGASAVRIDRVAAKLKLSKGSFHHHFDGVDAYKRQLLAHIEALSTEALERAVGDVPASDDPHAVLDHLVRLVAPGESAIYHPDLEVAVRAWSTWDPEVRAVQGRIDKARLAVLQRVWRPAVAGEREARTAALLPYLVALGAAVAVPPVPADELREVYELLLPLVPGAIG